MKCALPILLLLVISAHTGWPQQRSSLPGGFPSKFINKINNKSQMLDRLLKKQTIQYLQRLAHKEQQLKQKLACADTTEAKAFFDDAALQYKQLVHQFSVDRLIIPAYPNAGKKYLPFIDSIQLLLAYLQQNGDLQYDAQKKDKLNQSLQQFTTLQLKLQQAEYIKAFIRERKEQLKQVFFHYTKLPKNVAKQFSDFNKDIYYYAQQVNECRELLDNPDRLTQKALSLLNCFPDFKEFIQQHGELASLFGLPGIYNNTQALVGLQNRQQVQQLIQTQLSSAGTGAQQLLQQHIEVAQVQLSRVKDKLNKLTGLDGGDLALPANFEPNNQKTKSFLKRLEYGTNFQSVKPNLFFPATTDIGLSVGYKLTDRNVIGIGASYKIGWGKDIRHINIAQQGIGLRTFIDIQIKGTIYVSGCYEYNHQCLVTANSASIPPAAGGWGEVLLRSGLIGVSRMIPTKSKLLTKTKMQLLWDLLSYRQTPRTQSLIFRIGYNY